MSATLFFDLIRSGLAKWERGRVRCAILGHRWWQPNTYYRRCLSCGFEQVMDSKGAMRQALSKNRTYRGF